MLRLAFLAFLVSQQRAVPETCTVSGTVVSSVTGEPLNKAQLFADQVDSDAPPASTVTDDKGNFVLTGLDAGKYRLLALRSGYLKTAYGASSVPTKGSILSLDPGRELKDVRLKLIPAGVIAGTVRDPDGEPLPGIQVYVLLVGYADYGWYRRVLNSTSKTTDDLGQYRIYGLAPGKYYVEAVPRADPVVDRGVRPSRPLDLLLQTFYPSSQEFSLARAIEITPGAHIGGIDISLPRSHVFRVSGRVDGNSRTRAGVALEQQGALPGNTSQIGSGGEVKKDGTFVLEAVPPGSYVLRAAAFAPGNRISIARTPLNVGSADVTGIRITIEPGAEVTGHVTIAGEEAGKLNVSVFFFDGTADNRFNARVADDGSFVTTLAPSRYYVQVFPPNDGPPFYVESARSGGADVLREGLVVSGSGKIPLEIVVSRDAGQVSGLVLDKDDQPVSGATVLLAPEARLRSLPYLYQSTETDQNGRFAFKAVPPGDYTLFSWDDIEPGSWWDPDFLKHYEKQAHALTVAAKSQSTVTIK